jgi:hypothetical protein
MAIPTHGDESAMNRLEVAIGDRCNGEIDDGKVGDPATPGVKT